MVKQFRDVRRQDNLLLRDLLFHLIRLLLAILGRQAADQLNLLQRKRDADKEFANCPRILRVLEVLLVGTIHGRQLSEGVSKHVKHGDAPG